MILASESEHPPTKGLVSASPTQEVAVPHGVIAQSVVEVQHYTDWLFRFRTTRPGSFRFRSGEFVMIGLPDADAPIFRAYSIASPTWDDELEFYSIKVPGGRLTERLRKIQPGDQIWMRPKSTGTLVLDALLPGRRLFLLSTGTGIAPFASIIRDPETYSMFDQVVLTHTCRTVGELRYGFDVAERTRRDPLVGDDAATKLIHFATTTREESAEMGRISDRIQDASLFNSLGIESFDPSCDRVMICGSTAVLSELKSIVEATGFEEGSNSRPSSFVVERAFVG